MISPEKLSHAEEAFEKIWSRFQASKSRLRSLNERDKEELKDLMRTVFLSSLSLVELPPEIKLEMTSSVDPSSLSDMLRSALKEELGSVTDAIRNIQVTGAVGTRSVGAPVEDEAVALHAALFQSEGMSTNIDQISVGGDSVKGVGKNLDVLRKLMKEQGEKDA